MLGKYRALQLPQDKQGHMSHLQASKNNKSAKTAMDFFFQGLCKFYSPVALYREVEQITTTMLCGIRKAQRTLSSRVVMNLEYVIAL